MEVVPSEPPSRKLSRFAANLNLAHVPAPVRDRARLHILDGLGLGLASNAYDYGRRAVAGVAAMGAGGACSVLGRAVRLEVRDAALINGILIHGLDFRRHAPVQHRASNRREPALRPVARRIAWRERGGAAHRVPGGRRDRHPRRRARSRAGSTTSAFMQQAS